MLPLVKADQADVVEGPHAVADHDTAGPTAHVARTPRAQRVLLFVGIWTVHPRGTPVLPMGDGRTITPLK